MSLERMAAWLEDHPAAVDAFMVFWLAFPVLGFQSTVNDANGPEWFYLLWGLAYVVPLIWRRSHTDLVGLALIPPHVVQLVVEHQPVIGNIAVPIFIYTAALYSKWRVPWVVFGVVAAAAAGISWGYGIVSVNPDIDRGWDWTLVLFNFLMSALVVALSYVLGRLAYHRKENVQVVRAQMEALEREHEQVRELAAEQERSRIARDMHDVIAHSLSVIVVQADGAKYLLDQQESVDPKAAEAVGVIGETARHALAETRRLVGVLRSNDAAEMSPSVGLADLPALVARMQSSGIAVNYAEHGRADLHAPLSTGAETAVYRVVQEALTNVMKHAGAGAHAQVLLTHQPTGVTVQIWDDGVGVTQTDGLGHGIIGMRERVTAFGGQLTAGPRFDKGFEVSATLPAGY